MGQRPRNSPNTKGANAVTASGRAPVIHQTAIIAARPAVVQASDERLAGGGSSNVTIRPDRPTRRKRIRMKSPYDDRVGLAILHHAATVIRSGHGHIRVLWVQPARD